MKAITISAMSSDHGKTLLTTALLHWFKKEGNSVRAFKVGPDYIDPQFHKKITGTESINLDQFMMTESEVRKVFAHYSSGFQNVVIEGVMGFYDGMEFKTSTYDVSKNLNVKTLLLVPAEGSYITIIPQLKGMMDYRSDCTIKGVILNKISSEKHYKLIEEHIKSEIPDLKVLGWIKQDLITLSSRHLGLDLTELDTHKLDELSASVMKNIKTSELIDFMSYDQCYSSDDIFSNSDIEELKNSCKNLNLTIVNDKAFSFMYAINEDFLRDIFGKVTKISAINNESIPKETDVIYIPGGYVETPEVASCLHKANTFKQSLKEFATDPAKRIFAECAGMMFLGNKIETTNAEWIEGANLLPLNFEMQKIRYRLGYYKAMDHYNLNIYKGHSFHYSKAVEVNDKENSSWALFKDKDSKASPGAWTNEQGNITGTYLHSFFFNQPDLVKNYFIPAK